MGGIPSVLGRAGPAPGSVRRPVRSRLRGFVAGRARGVQAVVRVAPTPVLIGLSGPDHGMAGLLEVGRGMAVGTPVAAACPSARQALPQVFPGGTDLDARRADIERGLGLSRRLEMVAEPRHVTDISRLRGVAPGCRYPTPA